MKMLMTRKMVIAGFCAAIVAMASTAFAGNPATPFSQAAFKSAQTAGKPILVEIHADWCPTCRAQKPVLERLTSDPKFKNLQVFRVDFDTQKADVKQFGAQMQSTLIVFKSDKETGRSVGDTKEASIASLLAKAL
jgi:thiol-disulfide isomerase/thioredoxin